ncbi:alpha/beta hydrolase-fold protein [Actinomadura luteofluorescens]|uniref:alpha/beta hydrolase n=1 Tax=Actinomadura luteofluorescens TaxID=46163 RepID=UPI00362BBBDF
MDGRRKVRLLLPPGWSRHAERTWPALWLLHGGVDDYTAWTRDTDVAELTAGTGVIVVMPDGGRCGNYSDWWNYGNGGPPRWETFHMTELRRILERDYRAGTRRVIAGNSMGGLGAMLYAARFPGAFAPRRRSAATSTPCTATSRATTRPAGGRPWPAPAPTGDGCGATPTTRPRSGAPTTRPTSRGGCAASGSGWRAATAGPGRSAGCRSPTRWRPRERPRARVRGPAAHPRHPGDRPLLRRAARLALLAARPARGIPDAHGRPWARLRFRVPAHFARLAARYVTGTGRTRHRFAICPAPLASGIAPPASSRVRARGRTHFETGPRPRLSRL